MKRRPDCVCGHPSDAHEIGSESSCTICTCPEYVEQDPETSYQGWDKLDQEVE